MCHVCTNLISKGGGCNGVFEVRLGFLCLSCDII